ncbi:MAG: 4Fe-4S dicluster domain-containing protein [Sedimentisphaerales bacterium]|nr:4Fe-4S dicluster domain-containing protein [Sedimentisphaerales bacterium]
METTIQFLREEDLPAFCERLGVESLFGTVRQHDHVAYESLAGGQNQPLELRGRPPAESVKGFFFPSKERVAVYPAPESESLTDKEDKIVLIGARACDLAALAILDRIFIHGESPDPFYQRRRENSLLITVDCNRPAEYCFCNLLDGKPFVDRSFDIHLSPVEAGYLIAADSDKGAAVLAKSADLLTPAQTVQIEQRDRQRQEALDTLGRQNQEFAPPPQAPGAGSTPDFAALAAEAGSCVECGACSYICPTCHCFLLFDHRGRTEPLRFEREKTWDSCLLANFAKMAGVGGFKPTPRPQLRDRFENRLRHKFEWMVENLNLVGCVGCGRCRAACMGGCDIRTALQELVR